MNCDFKVVKLGKVSDVQTGPFGSQLHKEDYVLEGTPIITVEHLGKRKISYENLPLVSNEDKNRLNKYILKTGDMVFSRVGSVDRCSLVSEAENGWLFSGRCLRVRVDNKKIHPEYLYYFFCLENVKEYIRSIAVGATMPSLNTKILSDIDIIFQPISEQKSIAATLSCLDDKIELNNRINKTLEEMAQAVFKSWFVDFEPFQDGEFVDSELGMIPKGWKTGTLCDIGTIIGGSTPSKAKDEFYTNNGIAWITPKDLSINKNKFISHGEIDITPLGLKNSSAKIMPEGTVLFSARAPIGYMGIANGEVTTNQGFKSIVPNVNIGSAYIYYFLKYNVEKIENMASGSTFKEMSGTAMKAVEVLIPDNVSLSKFSNVCNAIFNKQRALEKENYLLANTRDTLLPKLMIGEIRMPVGE